MDLTRRISELQRCDLNCNVFSVYDYNGLSMQELLCEFFTKINECVDVSNKTLELAEWLVNEGLKIEVAKKLQEWLEDGSLANIINETIFNELNSKVNKNTSDIATANTKIAENKNYIDTIKSKIPYEDYVRQPVKYGKSKKLYEGSSIFSKQTYGTYENAAVGAFITGENTPVVEVLGTNTRGLSKYTNRDSVGLYVHNRFKKSNIIKLGGAVYSENKIVLPSVVNLDEVLEGMIIDTYDDSKQCVAIIKSVNKTSHECELVDGWYKVDPNTSTPTRETPSSSALFSINATNKVWGGNANIFVTDGCPAGCGLEIGVFCSHGNINDVGGIDVVNFENATHYGVKVRKGKQSFNNAFVSQSNGVAFSSEKCSGTDKLLHAVTNEGATFSVRNDGLMSKLKLKTQILSASGQLDNDTSVALVTGEGAIVSLPVAEIGKFITIIGFGNLKILAKTGSTIHTPKYSHQEIPINLGSGQKKTFIQLVGDGSSWFAISGCSDVLN